MPENITRRQVLKSAGAGALGVAVGSQAAGAQPDEERFIVGVDPGRADVARRRADEVHRVLDFGDIGQAVSGWFSEEALDELERNPNIRYIEVDGEMHALEETYPWGITRVGADVLHDEGETGEGADIAIIDTGIDSDHEDLQANLEEGQAFIECTENCSGPPWNGNDNDCLEPWDDDNDHGTHCAGTADAVDNDLGVVGVSTEATLHAAKVLECDGSGSYSDVAAGIEWAADQGYDVGSLSLGGDDSSTVQDACQYAYDKGVLLVAAAGNDGPCTDCVGYPAAYDTVVAVSATDDNDDLADFSSTGPEVELAAPGVDVLSTVPVDDYEYFDGTSMACPHVSGAGGQLMANGYSNTEARQRLQDTAEDIGLADNEQGYGLLDAEAAVLDDSDDGNSNSSPSCTIVDPNDGDTVSGTVTVQVNASDEEDDDTSLDVEVSIDDSNWQTATYNDESGYYEKEWDTTGVDDGDHTIQARATDSDGATTESAQITVTVDNSDDTSNSAPTIDQFDLTNDSNPAWTRYYVDWAVSDDDSDLSSVTSEMLDSSGSVLDSDSSSVGGSSDSGTHYVESKSNASEIRLTVTDSADNSTSDTESI